MNKTRDSRIGRRLRDRETLIGSSPRAARRKGIHLHGRTTRAADRSVTFHDGPSTRHFIRHYIEMVVVS